MSHLTVSDQKRNNVPTPCLDQVYEIMNRLGDKIEKKCEEEFERNLMWLFVKTLLCIVFVARVILGDNDEDVKLLKGLATDEGFKKKVQKELAANPEAYRERLA
jgi:hypothetical protein